MNPNEDTKVLGENLLSLRKKYHLTQAQMAKKLGIGIGSLRKLEHSVLPPRLTCDFLFAVYFQFGISPTQLFTPDLFDR